MSKKKNKQNNSMFIYTALIFVVALILIILAFFGQTNLSNLRRAAEQDTVSEAVSDEPITVSEQPTQTVQPQNEELAITINRLSNVTAENEELKNSLSTYESLLAANGYASVGNSAEAQRMLGTIDTTALTDDQKILFDQITNTINEGKEQ